MIMLEDDLGQCVQIKNVKRFCRHIKEFHSIGTSIHIERGHSFTVDDDFRIGYLSTTAGSSGNMRYFDGNIAIVRVYQRTLTHSEVLFNYSADTMRFGK